MLSDRYDAADEPEEIPEYKYLSQCSAPSLPRVTGCGMLSDDDDDFRLAYIEFEPFGDGFVSLEDHVAANGPMSEADVVSVTNDIISAIADIVLATDGGGHYNIHPGNVWVRFSEEGAKPEVRLTGTGYIGPSCNGITPFSANGSVRHTGVPSHIAAGSATTPNSFHSARRRLHAHGPAPVGIQ